MRLLSIVDVNLTLRGSDLKLSERRLRADHTTGIDGLLVKYVSSTRYKDLWMPEMSVAAAWVIVMKLAYGLDNIER